MLFTEGWSPINCLRLDTFGSVVVLTAVPNTAVWGGFIPQFERINNLYFLTGGG